MEMCATVFVLELLRLSMFTAINCIMYCSG